MTEKTPLPARLFVAVERCFDRDSPLAVAIDHVSRLRFPGDRWVLSSGPATHAFVICVDGINRPWRLDGTWPKAAKSIWRGTGKDPCVVWEIGGEQHDIRNAISLAYRMRGTPYDLGELVLQAFAPLTATMGLPIKVPYDGVKGGTICTGVACEVMRAAGHGPRLLADSVMTADHYPEELAIALSSSEDGSDWHCRVDPLTLRRVTP